MRHLLTILLLLIGAVTYGQTCDTVDGRTINCLDNLGQKQGYWKETKKHLEYSMYSGLGSKEGCRYSEVFSYRTVAEGEYKNNEKNGTWLYYYQDDKPYRYDIFYLNGKIIKESYPDFIRAKLANGNASEQNFTYNYNIEFNSDTSYLAGNAWSRNDTIQINCINKQCNFKTLEGVEFLSFSSDKLEGRLFLFSLGEYERDIRLKKTSR